MTQDTQAGAGEQPAPALQPEALRIAMHLRQRAQLSSPGNLDTLSAAGANELERQHAELSIVQAEAKHWRSNHDNVVARLRIFTQRPDIPKELADRLPWYRELVRLQEVEAQAAAKCMHLGAEPDKHMTIGRALREGLRAEPWISSGPGAAACVGLCAIQLQGWWHTAETAKAYADAYSRGADDMRAALQAAPPAPAAVAVPESHTQALKAIAEWPVTDMLLNMDAANMRGIAQRALAAAPAQAWPSECDSPELCRVHRGCAGQYGTKNTCPSFAVLNPCSPAAPAQAVAVPQAITDAMILAAWSAAAPERAGDITPFHAAEMKAILAAGIGAAPAQEHATQLAGQGHTPERQRMTAGRASFFMERFLKEEKLLGPNEQAALHFVIDMLAAPAQAQEDARDAGRWRHFSARGVFPKNVWNNGNGHWQYGEIRALTAEAVADAAIAARAAQGGAA